MKNEEWGHRVTRMGKDEKEIKGREIKGKERESRRQCVILPGQKKKLTYMHVGK